MGTSVFSDKGTWGCGHASETVSVTGMLLVAPDIFKRWLQTWGWAVGHLCSQEGEGCRARGTCPGDNVTSEPRPPPTRSLCATPSNCGGQRVYSELVGGMGHPDFSLR